MLKKNSALIIIILVQIIIFVAPYIYGYYHQNESFVFTGNVGPSNKNNDTQCPNCFYLTLGFKQSYDGAWLIEDKFQGYNTCPKIIHPWWIIGGHLARFLNVDILTFNILQRLLWITLSSIVVFQFAFMLFQKRNYSIFALLFFNFSSFLLFPTPEGSVFISNLAAVVLPMAYLSLAALFYLLYKFIHHQKVQFQLSIFTFILVIDYPYAILTFSASVFIFFIYLICSKQKNFFELAKLYFIIFFPAYLVVAYDFYLVITDPRLVGSQVHVISAPLGKLLLGYLPFSLFAILFAIKLFYKKGQQEYKNFWVYLYIFSVSSLLMTQIPTSILGFSMQMIVGIQLPLILMTLEYLRQYVIPKWRTVILVTTFIITIIPGGVFYKDIINNIQNHHIPSYIPSDIYKGIVWLDKNASKQSQLLCLPYWSSYAGIFSGTRLYIGGDVLFTPDFDNRLAKINKVLNYPQNESLVKFLQEEKIDYVFYDKKLQSLDVHGHFAKILNIVVYENNDVKILSCEKLFKNINQ